ncbi:hypothetical protein FNV43_RR03806 [Rhamnella rubrinervis]|uniref:Exopolygalacturonase n=1 Tax=Rhamnella rubrinervis TaxID=2594499 RepID=A0A8K0MP04_9ROSA|nr:hypothetical protein FNV43_RR03806 [Rhamnella rubrinervis]
MFSFVFVVNVEAQAAVFDVVRYGAVADGKTDNTKAFSEAWNQACQTRGSTMVLIPKGTYLLNPIIFEGPCKGRTGFSIQGTLKASTDKQYFGLGYWINFRYVNDLAIDGRGSLDGQGPSAWPYNSCSKASSCRVLPTSLKLDFITNSIVNGITLIDSKQVQINLFACQGLKISNVKIQAPADSPNTDGIHMGKSIDIEIFNSEISTGDDCISLSPGSRNINVHNVLCGPGHGISVGSLGKGPDEDDVEALAVRNSTFVGTENGVRVKTWATNYPSNVRNLTYDQIHMVNVRNPIIIDQKYCLTGNCKQGSSSSQVQIRDVKFRNIWGDSTSEVAVDLECSQSRPCQGIELNNIDLVYNKGPARSYCSNAGGVALGRQTPPSCL